MDNAFREQSKLIDEKNEELYEYDLYGRFSKEAITDMELDLQTEYDEKKKRLDLQENILNTFDAYGNDISNTFLYSKDMHRDQLKLKKVMNDEYNMMKKRLDQNLNENESSYRQFELYNYYYYKYKTQLRILYVFLAYLFFLILITLCNNYVSFLMTEKLYSLFIGISTAVFLIYFVKKLYDIYLRSETVFLEYDATWSPEEKEKIY